MIVKAFRIDGKSPVQPDKQQWIGLSLPAAAKTFTKAESGIL
jgi:hypothetical protein